VGAPEFPLPGSRARSGLASPRRPRSPAPLPTPSCCHPLHLLPPLRRAGEDALVSCSRWCYSNLSVRFRSLTSSLHTAAYRRRQRCAPSPTSAQLQSPWTVAAGAGGRRSPWPSRTLLRLALRPSPHLLLYICSASLFPAPSPSLFLSLISHRHHPSLLQLFIASLCGLHPSSVTVPAPVCCIRFHHTDCGLTAACRYRL